MNGFKSLLTRVKLELIQNYNAIIKGENEGIDPLDVLYTSLARKLSIRLEMCATSTRLCKFTTKLGFVTQKSITEKQIGTLHVKKFSYVLRGGGNIPLINAIIVRQYAVLFSKTWQKITIQLLII